VASCNISAADINPQTVIRDHFICLKYHPAAENQIRHQEACGRAKYATCCAQHIQLAAVFADARILFAQHLFTG